MADDILLPGTGQTVATKENGGRQYQEMLVVEKNGFTAVNPAVAEKQQSLIDLLTALHAIGVNKVDGSQINPATSEDISMKDILNALKTLIQVIANPPTTDKTANQIRAQVTGAVNSTATFSANQDIRNVTGSLTNIDIYQGRLLMLGAGNSAWALTVRNLIS